MLADPVFGDNGPQPQPQQGLDPRQQVMLALMKRNQKKPGTGWTGGLETAAQNALWMYGMNRQMGTPPQRPNG